MGFQGGLPLADYAPVAVDPCVGAFRYLAAGLNEEPGARWRLRAADDLDVDARLLGEFSGGGAGVALVGPHLGDVRAVGLGCGQQSAQDRAVLFVGGGDLYCEEQAGGVGEDVPEDESTTAPVGAASRPSASLARCRSATSVVSQTPRLVQRSIGLPGWSDSRRSSGARTAQAASVGQVGWIGGSMT